jgi:hypothetical protein
LTPRVILPVCPVCGAIDQAWRREWDYFCTDEFACRICHTVWYQDPKRPMERMVLVRGRVPGEPKRKAAPRRVSWWERFWAWLGGRNG